MTLQGSYPGTPDTGNANITGTYGSTHNNVHATISNFGLSLENNQAALVGQTREYSPGIRFLGAAWDTDGAVSNTNAWQVFGRPLDGNTTAIDLTFYVSTAGGAYAQKMYLDSAGKITLGESGVSVGAVRMENATSGSVTIQPPTGALGTSILSTPTGTDTLVARTSTDTLTNKTLTGPLIGNAATSGGYERYLEDTDNGANYIQLTGQDTLAANQILTLPGVTGNVVTDSPLIWQLVDDCDVNRSNSGLDNGCRFADGTVSGTGAQVIKQAAGSLLGPISADHPGVVECQAGTAANGFCWLSTATSAATGSFIVQNGFKMYVLVKFGVAQTADPRAIDYIGMTNTVTGSAPGEGIFLSGVDNVNSGNWVMNVCKNAGTCTTGNSATAVPASAYRWYGFAVDAGGVHFYDCGATWPATGEAGCTEMTNSPLVSTNLPAVQTGFGIGIVKTVDTGADDNRGLALDYFRLGGPVTR